jgi:AcrR family transcriptional regulator
MIKSTAQTIVAAAQKTLLEEGFSGTTSRAIARAGGFNQALIFYHYGSVEGLLVTALRETSERRLARYRERLAPISTVTDLMPAMAELWEEDRAAGHVQLVSQMVAGSIGSPELARQVVELMNPWVDLARETLAHVLPPHLPIDDLAYAVCVWYLGVDLLTHLDPERAQSSRLLERAGEFAPVIDALLANVG